MENHEEVEQPISEEEIGETELSEEELDEASGGIIVVGGKTKVNKFQSHINFSELNPQPLPPGPPDFNKLKGLGNLSNH